jgi:NADPH:quinone reductase-like Zn-dependent oxidoreductase
LIPPTDIARWGTYGKLANVPARNLVEHPENISFEVAAASWMQYVTAWGALIEQAKLSAGDFVIITAASSSVGIAALQIAKAVGATIIATTRSRAKRQALIEHGADHLVVTDEEDLVALFRGMWALPSLDAHTLKRSSSRNSLRLILRHTAKITMSVSS